MTWKNNGDVANGGDCNGVKNGGLICADGRMGASPTCLNKFVCHIDCTEGGVYEFVCIAVPQTLLRIRRHYTSDGLMEGCLFVCVRWIKGVFTSKPD